MGAYVHIDGYLGADPELKYGQEGQARCKLRIGSAGQPRPGTEQVWLNATVWGKRAETVAEHLRKGSYVIVHGTLERRKWEDQDGNPREAMEINSATVNFGPKTEDADDEQPRRRPQQEESRPASRQRQAQRRPAPPADDDYDDLPF